jgi:hypothetical protein
MEPEGSLPHSQKPVTCPYPESDRFFLQARKLNSQFTTFACYVTLLLDYFKLQLLQFYLYVLKCPRRLINC